MSEVSWTVIVPVKRLATAKSRLRGGLGAVPRERLALALALDTVAAALSCPAVARLLVVTADPVAGAALRALGARIVPDPPVGGLNGAFRAGAELARDDDRHVAALTADLPALRPAELAAALRAAARGPGHARHFVADAPATGTVLLTAAPGVTLDPRFGVGSAAAHAASGARPLTGDWPSLRRDVDTPADLALAAALGLGPHTAALLPAPAPAES
ncbi:2-phospho-L-lactate guanylyltransferase [Micromonospora pattaloongensis]|uniref:Phosphoenolpyruvate guanylyltransferase n=1 Tax=Micromonospora pattaloongensis TaxID=405436 RepID=A0A1H3KUA2_9ACTN|nr:2-phospho-L-lactate guanylyltransferase [Micromonospora pattaloongensis]SDY55763.1 2-phospho-L-lactate guanylyltransferase [Micromonospora pattaloongensis]